MDRDALLPVALALVSLVILAGCVSSTTSGPNASANGSAGGEVPNSSVGSSIADDLDENGSGESADQDNPFQSLMANVSDGENGSEATGGGGASDGTADGGGDGSDGSDDAGSGTDEATFGDVETASGGSGATGAQTGIEVVDVVSPDNVRIEYPNGSTSYVRLIGIKTPPREGTLLVSQYETIENIRRQKQCLRQWGGKAHDRVTADLEGTEVKLAFDDEVQNTKKYVGLQAYLVVDGENYNKQLVEEGYARVFTEGFSQQLGFESAERSARRRSLGLWQCSATAGGGEPQPLVVDELQAEVPAGTDQENLNKEYIRLKNEGSTPIDMSGWSIHTNGSRGFSFPDTFELRPGRTVTVHSGSAFEFRSAGEHATDLYWGSISPVWPNDDGVAVVKDASFKTVIRHEYGR